MTTDLKQTFPAHTMYTLRPSVAQEEYRAMTPDALKSAQSRWDAAESIRLDGAQVAIQALVLRDESREEPTSKALENRLRVAFLATKGATMQAWLQERESILASLNADEPKDQG